MRKYLVGVMAALVIAANASAQTPYFKSDSGTVDATDEWITIDTSGLGSVGADIRGTFSATLAVQCTVDGTNWLAVRMTPGNTTTAVTSMTAAGQWTNGAIAGCRKTRIGMTNRVSGSADVVIRAVQGGGGGAGSSGGGGGGAGTSDTTEATQLSVLSSVDGVETLIGTTNTDLGAAADASSATGSIAAKLRFIASTGIPITGTVTVGSHAVTNAGTFAVQAAQSGTWTVLPGNTANTTAWLVTGTGGTFPATQSGTWNITNVSGTVSLPTGASTAAKQPALGTAGTASTDVISVQGITSMTPLLTTLSGTNNINNVSGTVSLPTGASTSANQTTELASLSSIDGKFTAAAALANTTANPTVTKVGAFPHIFNGTTWDRWTGAVTGSGNFTVTQATGSNLHVQCDSGCSSSTAPNDNTAFTAGTTAASPVAGYYLAARTALTDGREGAIALNAKRGMFVTLEDASSVALTGAAGTASAAVLSVQGIASMTPILTAGNVTPADNTTPTNAVPVTNYNMCFDGTNWDRCLVATGGAGVIDSNTTRMTIATDDPQVAGWTPFNATAADGATACTSTAQAVKASAGRVGGYYINNPNTADAWLHIYNVASGSVTVGTTNPLVTFRIPGNATNSGAANWSIPQGITFGTAIAIACTSTAAGSGAPSNALEADIYYR